MNCVVDFFFFREVMATTTHTATILLAEDGEMVICAFFRYRFFIYLFVHIISKKRVVI